MLNILDKREEKMSKPPSSTNQQETPFVSSPRQRDNNKTVTLEINDPDNAAVTITRLIEQLHAKKSSEQEKELSTARLLGLAKGKKECRKIIGQNANAMPAFISLLRNGTLMAKLNSASVLIVLCKDKSIRPKVLIGGCIPPLLLLLKSDSVDARKVAAAAIYEVSLCGMDDDNVGTKIFVTEGVVPSLWDQLKLKRKQDKTVEGYLVGALKNLCGDRDGFWVVTLEEGGVHVILRLLQSSNPVTQANAASLVAHLCRIFTRSIPKIVESGVVQVLVQLLGEENCFSVRASVVNALETITSKSEQAKNAARNLNGIHLLIGAVVASSKESVDEENERILQSYGTQALANLCGGMSALIVYLGGLSLSPRLTESIADILGALAYALRKFQLTCGDDNDMFDPTLTEGQLVKLLKPRDTETIQERYLEAMESLYGNADISKPLNNVETKRILVGLTILASGSQREQMVTCLSNLCKHGNVWDAIGKREGIQILIPFLGLSTEQHQELSVEFLAILTDKVEESRWAVTSAGGIPPLIQILETGVSHKAKDNAVRVLWNLCYHSEEIRVCVEKAGAIPALLGLLKNGGLKSQENSANTLMKLIKTADPSVIEQVQALFLGDAPKSKAYLIKVLGHVLASASLEEFITKGSAANDGLRSLVQRLASSNERMKENAASVLVDLFSSRKDLCGALGFDENDNPCTKLLSGNTHAVATQLAHALGALSNPTRKKTTHKKLSGSEVEVIKPLIKSEILNPIESAENPMFTLADLSDQNISAEALNDDDISALTRVLREGTLQSKRKASHALHKLLKHIQVSDVSKGNDQYQFAIPELIDLLNTTDLNNNAFIDVSQVLSLLANAKYGANLSHDTFTEVPSSLNFLVCCLAEGHPLVQDKAIEILSLFCKTQFVLLGQLLVRRSKSISSLANRTIGSSSPEIKGGGALLLVCAAKNNKKLCAEAIGQSGYLKSLVSTLLEMSKHNSKCSSNRLEIQRPRSFIISNLCLRMDNSDMVDPVTVKGCTISMWLLSIISSSHPKNRLAVMEANGLEIIVEKLQQNKSNTEEHFADSEEKWIAMSFLAVMSQEPKVVSSAATKNILPTLSSFMQSDQIIDGYFTAQALAVLVRQNNEKIIAEIMDSGIIETTINLVGYSESDTRNLGALAEELSLLQNPFEATLEAFFENDRVKHGSMTNKCVPLLVNLLKTNANKPGAFSVAIRSLSCIAEWDDSNKLLIAEAGALDALAKYLSLSPQDSTVHIVSELLGSLFRSPEITRHKTANSSMKRLIEILHLSSRSTRYNAARVLCELFSSEHIRDSKLAWNSFSPLIDMLDTTLESERKVALTALVKLTMGKCPRPDILSSLDGNPLEKIYKILSSDNSLESKTNAARTCCFLGTSEDLRTSSFAVNCIVPLISLIRSGRSSSIEAGMVAFDRLLDSKRLTEVAEKHDCVNLFYSFVASENYLISEAAISCLVKMAKDKTPRKLDLIKMGIIEQCLSQLSRSPPSSLCSVIVELFRVLTNVGAIARSSKAIKMVEPLLLILLRQDLDFQGQLSGLQAIANILEKLVVLGSLKIASSAIIMPLIPLLESESMSVQNATAELLTSLLEMQCFKDEILTKDFIAPLLKITGTRVRNLQEIALTSLKISSVARTKEVANAKGIRELSKVIIDEDPQLPIHLWELAAFIICNILKFNPEQYYVTVTIPVLTKMLFSRAESTVILAIDALITHEKQDSSSVLEMVKAGALNALLDLVKSHHCEDISGKLLELILRNPKVRETKICKFVITPLSEYILDPKTKSKSAKLFAAMAVENISQHEGLTKATDSVLACRALISLIEKKTSDKMQMVVMCALRNFAIHSRTSRKAIAEFGGVNLILKMLGSCNPQVSTQAALMIKSLFSNHTLQEYISCEIITSLTTAMERELWTTATINIEVVRTLNAILTTFSRLRASEAATACIPHLVGALNSGDTEARDLAMDTLYTLRRSWTHMPIKAAKAQAILAAEAIPILQLIIKSKSPAPASFHERVNSLLNCLPGSLVVTIKRGDNLKNANAFCSLIIENCSIKRTKVVKRCSSPVWKESFTWDFAVPPRGQFLEIICKSNNLFRYKNLGRVRISIDKVLEEGNYSGIFKLSDENKKDNSSNRSLEIEIVWSNQTY